MPGKCISLRIPWAVTKEALARVLQLNVSMLDRYQHIKEYVEQVIEHRARRKPKYSEDELVGKVQEAVESFRSLGKPITHKSIANEICVDSEVLRHSLRASAVVGRAIEEDRADRLRKYEDKLINRIQSAVQELNLSGDAVTKMAVGRKIHVIPQVLKHYARVDAFLNQLLQENAEREFRRWEEELFGQVQAAIQQLESCRRRVTENAICTIVQAPPTRLRKSSRIRAILEQVREKSPGRIRERTGICEDDLLHKMQCAMEHSMFALLERG